MRFRALWREGELLKLPRRRRILCLCDPRPGCTSAYRLESLRRLGQEVIVFDVTRYWPQSRLMKSITNRFPAGPIVYRANRALLEEVRRHQPDVVWFDKPTLFTGATIEAIRSAGALTVCYNQDNPFGPRHDGCWYQFKKVFRLFDLHCLFRQADVARYAEWGLSFIKVLFSFEPSIHFAPGAGWSDADRTREVSYIGHPHEERPQFLLALAEKYGVSLSIDGNGWQSIFGEDQYRRYVRLGHLLGDAYREQIWRSKINLSFVTRSNEDDIAHKSVEITACQGFLLALRTEGHQAIFEEDREAVFFSSEEECADQCRFYLGRPDLREAIARGGRERAVRSGYDNDTQLARVLDRLDGGRGD